MISKKTNVCPCGRNAYGYKECAGCRGKRYAENSKKRKDERGGESGIDDLDEYYNFHIGNIIKTKACCAECGVRLPQIPDRKNVCHLLAKSLFPSVRSLTQNCVYLCWDCHTKFDSNFDKAKTMKIWKSVAQTVKSFLHIVKERHKALQHYED